MTHEPESRRSRDARDSDPDADADAVLAACRVLVAISAQSIAAVEHVADLMQVRALVVIDSRESVSLSELSDAMKIHLTRASRLCDRLVAEGLVNRVDDLTNRRQLSLTLTQAGQEVVREVMRRRREAIQPILDRMRERMTEQRRAELISLLDEFASAGADVSDPDLWAMGWAT